MLRCRDIYPRSRIRLFPSRIPNPRLTRFQIRIRIKEFTQVFLIQKTYTKSSKVRYGMFIPDLGPGSGFFSIPDTGSRGQKSTGIRIRNAAALLMLPSRQIPTICRLVCAKIFVQWEKYVFFPNGMMSEQCRR